MPPGTDAPRSRRLGETRPAAGRFVAPVRGMSTGLVDGEVINNTYRIRRRVAGGGMGEIYEASHTADGVDDRFAIKVIKQDALSETALNLFKAEAKILSRIQNEAVVRCYGVQVDQQGRLFLAMEFIDGPSLSAFMRKRGALSPAQVLALCRRLIGALAAIHAQGVVHRDLSPHNILLPQGQVEEAKIIDFGVARDIVSEDTQSSEGGKPKGEGFAGKFGFAAPEQFPEIGGTVDDRADVYALGLLIAACLLGRPLPMGRDREDAVAKRQGLPSLTGIPRAFHPFLEAALQPDPENRPGRVEDLLTYLPVEAGGGAVLTVNPLYLLRRALPALFGQLPERAQSRAARIRTILATLGSVAVVVLLWSLWQQMQGMPPGTVFRDCTLCPEMVVLPEGEIMVGSDAREPGHDEDEPQYPVRFSDGFALGRTEVTIGEYQACVDEGRCSRLDFAFVVPADGLKREVYPAVGIEFADAQTYVEWLAERTGKPYRLPTEDEWEYAARAGTMTRRYWGADPEDKDACDYANGLDGTAQEAQIVIRDQQGRVRPVMRCYDDYARLAPVGLLAANAFNLHDILGNAWEWVADCYSPSRGRGESGSPGCRLRVLRGGSWKSSGPELRAANRYAPLVRDESGQRVISPEDFGFRVMRPL